MRFVPKFEPCPFWILDNDIQRSCDVAHRRVYTTVISEHGSYFSGSQQITSSMLYELNIKMFVEDTCHGSIIGTHAAAMLLLSSLFFLTSKFIEKS